MKTIEDLSDQQIMDGLLRIAPHVRIAHHLPGRIRLKISLEGVKALNGKFSTEEPIRIPGILGTRINTFARSMIIDYDDEKIPYELWERLGRIGKGPGNAKSVVRDLRRIVSGEDPAGDNTSNLK